ncbi:protein SPEC3-like [Chiloscyllium plagiosum]|uniref:protein SPEC3-like n=1 Tax=Chiloscyllium plagiosum TaxID=36176 RepID=UPI001CB80A02|nr:protein SPEC3-like [Chiloscyllium plagiosum]
MSINKRCPTFFISHIPETPSHDKQNPGLGCRPVNLWDGLSIAHLDLRRASLTDSRNNLVSLVRGVLQKEEEDSANDTDDPEMKPTKITGAIPCMSRSMAVFCLILNIILPGTGTILSGFTLLCCSEPATPTGRKTSDEMMALVCLNVWVGISQLFTVPFLLVGWLWSITWGVMMINLSYEQRNAGEAQTVTMETKTETVFLPSWINDSVK